MNYDIIYLGTNNKDWDEFKIHYPRAYRMPPDAEFDQLKKKSLTKMFWVVWDNLEIDYDFDLNSYRADKYDDMFVHIFKNGGTFDGVCLFPKNLNPSKVEFKHKFFINRKEVNLEISRPKKQDEFFEVVFISYNEPNAEKNFRKLKQKAPAAHRIHGVKGIHNAHREAAKLVTSEMFYVVDGDADIDDNFRFDHSPDQFQRDTVYVWASNNPINGLKYGYGGVKLLPRSYTLDVDSEKTDMTTSISGKFKYIDTVSNTTEFNTDPFNTWKSAFRECAKLSSKIIPNQVDDDTEERLKIWKTVGSDKPFGQYALTGAEQGYAFGLTHRTDRDGFESINDFDWLKQQFDKVYE